MITTFRANFIKCLFTIISIRFHVNTSLLTSLSRFGLLKRDPLRPRQFILWFIDHDQRCFIGFRLLDIHKSKEEALLSTLITVLHWIRIHIIHTSTAAQNPQHQYNPMDQCQFKPSTLFWFHIGCNGLQQFRAHSFNSELPSKISVYGYGYLQNASLMVLRSVGNGLVSVIQSFSSFLFCFPCYGKKIIFFGLTYSLIR